MSTPAPRPLRRFLVSQPTDYREVARAMQTTQARPREAVAPRSIAGEVFASTKGEAIQEAHRVYPWIAVADLFVEEAIG